MTFITWKESRSAEQLLALFRETVERAGKAEQSMPSDNWRWELHEAHRVCVARRQADDSVWQRDNALGQWRLYGIPVRIHVSRGRAGSQLVVTRPVTTVYPGPQLERVALPDTVDM